jgi:hypothetical protein
VTRTSALAAALLVLALAGAGCQKGTFVQVTLSSSGQSYAIASLEVAATNAGKTARVRIDKPFTVPPEQSFSLRIEDDRTGEVSVTVTAFDAGHQQLASATDNTTIVHDGVAQVHLDLAGGGPPPPGPDLAGADLAGADLLPPVVDMQPSNPALASFAVSTTASSVAEHQLFSVHVIARDKDGKTLTGYAGTPTLTSDWGDVRLAGTPSFAGGEADLSVAVNRETSVAGGLVHLTVSDGTASGASGGITVTVPLWAAPGTPFWSPSPSPEWDRAFDFSSSGFARDPQNGHYFLFYSAAIPGSSPSYGVGLAASDDGATLWTRAGGSSPVFKGGVQAWEGDSTTAQGVIHDGQLIMVYRARRSAKDGFGIAVSIDGKSWTRASNNPILPGVTTACTGTLNNVVIAAEGQKRYRLLATTPGEDKYCTFTFELTGAGATLQWANVADVQQATGLPVGWYPQAYVKEGNVYKLYSFDGSNVAHYATSADGVKWVPSPTDPVNYAPPSMFWNPMLARYEAVVEVSGKYARTSRP